MLRTYFLHFIVLQHTVPPSFRNEMKKIASKGKLYEVANPKNLKEVILSLQKQSCKCESLFLKAIFLILFFFRRSQHLQFLISPLQLDCQKNAIFLDVRFHSCISTSFCRAKDVIEPVELFCIIRSCAITAI